MPSSAFLTPDDEQRYRDHFAQDSHIWTLESDEHAAADVILRLSPTLRPFGQILDRDLPRLDMEAILQAAERGGDVRAILAAALSIVTVPNLAWAYLGDPLWSTLGQCLDPEDLAAFAAARRIKTGGPDRIRELQHLRPSRII